MIKFKFAAVLAAGAALALSPPPIAAQTVDDPFIWLEDREGEKPLAWSKAESARTVAVLEKDPRFSPFQSDMLTILQAQDRIPSVTMRPDGLYNFWQDQTHVRGIWRRTALDSYRTSSPVWETLLDVDALAKIENRNWVYQGANCLPPEYRRCLVTISDGGKDANVFREFDTVTKSFVEGGFNLPESRQVVAWLDQDTLLVSRDWGAGTLTKAGYPFIIKRLKRGQSLDQAQEIMRGLDTDARIAPWVLRDAQGVVHGVGGVRNIKGRELEFSLLTGSGSIKLPLPKKAQVGGIVDGRLLVTLEEGWAPAPGLAFKAGSLLSYDLAEWKRDPVKARPSMVFEPNARQTLNGTSFTRNKMLLTILDNVRGQAFAYDYENGAWKRTSIPLPKNATIGVGTASSENDLAIFTVTDYLTPPTLSLYDGATNKLLLLKSSPARFDASRHVIEQLEATSNDGTKIPYFLVRPKEMKRNGSTPTLLYGYGGFNVKQLPSYSSAVGKLWLEEGNAYVVGNIRGGGEFGPKWHQAAVGANKQRTWDDFIAIAEDLIKRKVTSPRRLGIMGGSQGGLLVGAALTQRPELFNAAVVQVPLLDMLRYTKMGTGAGWIGEYGDPEDPAQRPWLAAYSPYQKLVKGKTYPVPFFTTSVMDDRVHPGHARKAAAKMKALGQPYYYYESADGGHSSAANLRESARQLALQYTYLTKRLVD